MMVRKGKVVGIKVTYPKMPIEITEGELLSSFMAQFYLGVFRVNLRRLSLVMN